MRNAQGVGFIFSATDLVSGTMRRMGKNYDDSMRRIGAVTRDASGRFVAFSEGTKVMAKGAAALVGVAVAAKGVSKAMDLADAAGNFEAGMATVAAISNIAVDSEDAVMLSTVAMDAALKTKFSPRQAADGLANFASQGFTAAQQAQALVPALRLAQAGMIGVDESAAAMTSALKVFSIEADQAGVVTDKLLKIANLTSLQAGDLELALGTVGRGASAAKQGIDEMLITMGLVKNTGVDASVAASSVSSALIYMAKNQSAFEELGVSVTDANGKFRDFIDIARETDIKLADKFDDEGKRVKASMELFGKFGLTAFQAVNSQINAGVRTTEGALLQGAEAVDYLRTTMKNAEGTAAEFESKMLGTFEGQKQLLEGVVEGFKVALGQPFLEVFKPMVGVARGFIESLASIINAIPPGVKVVIAKLALSFLGLVAAISTLVALKAGIQLAGMAMRSFGITASLSMGPLLILVGVVAALGLAFAAFRTRAGQMQDGLGGIFEIGSKVKLFFQGLVQYLKDGELSGAVLDELNKAENEGIKQFLGKVLDFGDRVIKFFEGVQEGFSVLVEAAQPAFQDFAESISMLTDTVGDFSGMTTGSIVEGADAAKSRGMEIGMYLGRAAILVVEAMTLVIKIVAITVGFLNSLGISIETAIGLWAAYKVAMMSVAAYTAGTSAVSAAGAAFTTFAAAASKVTLIVPALVAGFAAIKAGAMSMLAALAGPAGIVALVGAALLLFTRWADTKFGISDKLADWMEKFRGTNEELEKLTENALKLTEIRGFGGDDPFAGGRTAQLAAEQGMSLGDYQAQRMNELAAEGWDAKINPDTGDVEIVGRVGAGADGGAAGGGTSVTAGVERAAAVSPVVPDQASFEDTRSQMAALSAELDKLANRPVLVNVNVDSEKIAEATAQGQASARGRAFSPTPAEG